MFAAVALNLIPAEVVAFADSHDGVATQVQADSTADQATFQATNTSLGPAGAAFTAAVESFAAALVASASQLSGEYWQMARALRSGTQLVVATDESAAGQFRSPTTAV